MRPTWLLAAALLSACAVGRAPALPPAPMGTYMPLAWDSLAEDIVLTAPACTAIIQIDALPPGEFFRGHLTFVGRDPEFPQEARCHQPGPYPYLQPWPDNVRIPPMCGSQDVPSLGGCRQVSVPVPQGVHVESLLLYLASDEPIDPFRMAWELESALVRQPRLQEALWRRELPAAARLLEAAIRDIPGSPTWAGLLLKRRQVIRRGWM